MDWDKTPEQSPEEQRRSRELSRHAALPPTSIPGVRLIQFLGEGAFGEVWIGEDEKMRRKVAVKFFTGRGDVEWTRLRSEVEKLVLLSADRRIVQILDVGWDSDPPYYVMEYLEAGSLEDLLQRRGALPVETALPLVRELAVGLQHAHAKGVLHCDLKPANVLLDDAGNPRLCDFGQSRMTNEQSPSLGTLFYMAPEQASFAAIPEARWDVYGLGAILYTLLTGNAPFRSEKALERIGSGGHLVDRLARYREWIAASPLPQAHRRVAGVDRALATIIDRCLAVAPEERFGNIQEVLDAFERREQERARRPLVWLGIIVPVVLIAIMSFFAWRGLRVALSQGDLALSDNVRELNQFAARYVAQHAERKLERYFRLVEHESSQAELIDLVRRSQQAWRELTDKGIDAGRSRDERADAFRQVAVRQRLDAYLYQRFRDPKLPRVASWFLCGADGTQYAFVNEDPTPLDPTVGGNYAYRTYFHGGPHDLPPDSRPPSVIERTVLSSLLKSTATNTWKVAVSTPLHDPHGDFLGVVGVTFEVGDFIRFFEPENAADQRFVVLVDGRPGPYQGMILQHPLFERIRKAGRKVPDKFSQDDRYRVDVARLRRNELRFYGDPIGDAAEGSSFRRTWIAAWSEVEIPREPAESTVPSGLLVVVQQDHQAIVAPIERLGRRLVAEGLSALAFIVVTVLLVWYLVIVRLSSLPRWWLRNGENNAPTSKQDLAPTVTARPRSEANDG